MAAPLPRLRTDLDFMPSPVEDRPGLLIRDSFRYSNSVMIIPPQLVECLACFDGQQTQLDLRAMLVQASGELQVGDLEQQFIDVLTQSGFLEDETFAAMKEQREREFAEATVRLPSHAGSAYPEDRAELRGTMKIWMGAEEPGSTTDGLVGIASLFQGMGQLVGRLGADRPRGGVEANRLVAA